MRILNRASVETLVPSSLYLYKYPISLNGTPMQHLVTAHERRYGILKVRISEKHLFPQLAQRARIKVLIEKDELELLYDPNYNRLRGLGPWYKRRNVEAGDSVQIDNVGDRVRVRL